MTAHNCTWIAWRNSVKNFGLFHRSYDPEHKFVVCGKTPAGIISTRTKPPKPQDECGTCRQRDSLRIRKALDATGPLAYWRQK